MVGWGSSSKPKDETYHMYYAPGIPMRPGLPGSERVKFREGPPTFFDTNKEYANEDGFPICKWAEERSKKLKKEKAANARATAQAARSPFRYYPVEVPVPVQVPVQVPVHVPVPTPVMYMPHPRPFIVPCQCVCCLSGCPGPEAHYLAYNNQHTHAHNHRAATPGPSKENAKKRENLNRILEAKRFPLSRTPNQPLIDLSGDSMTYIYDRYDRKQLDELATTPALQEMKITHSDLPWEVAVRSKDERGITIRDVLDAIYNELNIPVTEDEANKMRGQWLVMRYRDRTSNAKRSGDRYAGLKRMHWMRLENHNLIGLEPHKNDKWLMVFEKASES